MRFKLLMPVLAVVLLQSCADRVEETEALKATETVNTTVPVENTYTGAEPAAASPDINNEAAATTVSTGNTDNNNKAATNSTAAYRTTNNRANTGNRANRTKSSTPVVQTASPSTPGFKASYQVPRDQYNEEVRAIREREASSATAPVAYQRVQIKRGNMRASYDMPGDAYNGEDVLSHDGVEKNLERNVNYLDFTGGKVPNDGGQPYKK